MRNLLLLYRCLYRWAQARSSFLFQLPNSAHLWISTAHRPPDNISDYINNNAVGCKCTLLFADVNINTYIVKEKNPNLVFAIIHEDSDKGSFYV